MHKGLAIGALLLATSLTVATKGMKRGNEPGDGKPIKALVVGVGDFKELGKDAELPYAEKDAEAFAETLRSVVTVDELQVLTGHEATHEVLSTSVTTLLSTATEDEVVVLYFATHGAKIGRKGFLMAWDTQPEGQLAFTSLKLVELKKAIAKSEAGQVLLFADTAHQVLDDVPESVKTGPAYSVNPLIGALALEQDRVFVMTANQGHSPSATGEEFCGGHGLFTCALMEALGGEADVNGDAIVELAEVATTVPAIVASRSDDEQLPGAYGRYEGDLGVQASHEPTAGWEVLDAVDVCFGSQGFPVAAEHPFKTGETFEMAFTLPQAGYLYVENYGPDGEHNKLFPWVGEDPRVSAGSTIVIPPPDGEPITFTDPTGRETLLLTWSPVPLDSPPPRVATKGMKRGAEPTSRHCSRYLPTAGSGETWTIEITLDHQ